MNRRGFLGAILAAGAAPGIIKIENAMRIVVPKYCTGGIVFSSPNWMHLNLDPLPILGNEEFMIDGAYYEKLIQNRTFGKFAVTSVVLLNHFDGKQASQFL